MWPNDKNQAETTVLNWLHTSSFSIQTRHVLFFNKFSEENVCFVFDFLFPFVCLGFPLVSCSLFRLLECCIIYILLAFIAALSIFLTWLCVSAFVCKYKKIIIKKMKIFSVFPPLLLLLSLIITRKKSNSCVLRLFPAIYKSRADDSKTYKSSSATKKTHKVATRGCWRINGNFAKVAPLSGRNSRQTIRTMELIVMNPSNRNASLSPFTSCSVVRRCRSSEGKILTLHHSAASRSGRRNDNEQVARTLTRQQAPAVSHPAEATPWQTLALLWFHKALVQQEIGRLQQLIVQRLIA